MRIPERATGDLASRLSLQLRRPSGLFPGSLAGKQVTALRLRLESPRLKVWGRGDLLRFALKVAAAATTAITAMVVVASPASANNPTLSDGWGTTNYNDLLDRVCVKAYDGTDSAQAWITDADNTLVIIRGSSIDDTVLNDGKYVCSGNLSIPEDKRHYLWLRTWKNGQPRQDAVLFWS
ncbi:hypothetical protein ACFQ68_00010 [Amycolatopsis japonica]|uniref:hypothetical protein n=1 Tax=Amycolatopsis japonica TaxID=208439 RepID=UPI0036735764